MHLTPLQYVLWVLPPPLQLLICGTMLKRRQVPELPLFFAYTLFQALRSCVQFYVFHTRSYASYQWIYIELYAISTALGFAVIYEVYCEVFRRYEAIRRLGSLLFRWAAVVLLMVALIMVLSGQGTESERIVAGLLAAERSVRVAQCGLLFFLFLFARYFGLSWKQYIFGIGLGFGLFATVELMAVAVRMEFGLAFDLAFRLVNSAAYDCAVLIWVVYLFLPQPADKRISKPPKYNLEAWNRALLQLLTR